MAPRPRTDKEIRDVLFTINMSAEIRITTPEAEFLEDILFPKQGGEWTVKQRGRAAQIAERYRNRL